jgi:hypothetical protein
MGLLIQRDSHADKAYIYDQSKIFALGNEYGSRGEI